MLNIPRLLLAPGAAVWLIGSLAAQEADESRFNPPHKGSRLGLLIQPEDEGLQIQEIVPGGAAERAGLMPEDIIVGFGEWSFDAGGQPLPDYLASASPTKTLAQIERDGEQLEIEITADPLLVATARDIASRLQRHRLFKRSGQGDLDTLEEDLVSAVRNTESREAAYAAMNDVIDRFDLSHTAILTPWVSQNLFGKGEHFHLGMFIQGVDTDRERRHFIRSMMFGSPARGAGLRVGDELVAVNGVSFSDSPRRTLAGFEARRNMYTLQIDRDEDVEIRYRRKEGGKIKRVKVAADRALDAVTSAQKSVRVVGEDTESPIGYVHFWNVMSSGNIDVLNSAIGGEFVEAKALAVDLRGRGGSVAVIAALSRILSEEPRPIALLIDREARSAKEMLAHRLKGHRHITLVGETTAGAVLPANFVNLPGGARLMLPVSTGDSIIRLYTGGQRLEGRGAIPDIDIDAPLPYRAGKDVILDRALALLRKLAAGELVKL